MMDWTIHLPVEYFGHEISLTLRSAHKDWSRFRPEYREGGIIQIPPDQFCTAAIVPDLTLSYSGGVLGSERVAQTRPGGVVVLLESPHKGEYAYAPFRPLEPLRGSRWMLERHLPSVLEAVRERYGIAFSEGDVTLCNPVPVQTSCYRLLEGKGGLAKEIRNSVWRELYRLAPVVQHFTERMARYAPSLILNGCTKELSPHVEETLSAEGYGPITVPVDHPSAWYIGRSAEKIRAGTHSTRER